MTTGSVSVLDWIVLALLLGGAVRGYIRGLSRELGWMIAAGAILFAAWSLNRPLGNLLIDKASMEPARAYGLAGALIVVAGIVAAFLLQRVLSASVQFSFKGQLERTGGALAGLFSTAVLLTLVLYAMSLLPVEPVRRAITLDSWAGRQVCQLFPSLYEKIRRVRDLPDLPRPKPVDPPEHPAGPGAGAEPEAAADPNAIPPVEPVPTL